MATPETALVTIDARAVEVFNEIKQIKSTLMDNLLQVGELVSEAYNNNHAQILGYMGFGEWLEASSLDMSLGQAYHLIKIIDKAKKLGISHEDLKQSKISKLKDIFTLNPDTQGDIIKQLVEKSKTASLSEIRDELDQYKTKDGEEPLTWRNFRVLKSQAEIIDQALEKAKNEAGSTIDGETHEVTDISNSKALELICADYLSN